MHTTSRPGGANVAAILLSAGVLILCLAGAYYLIAVLPTQSSTSDDSSSSAMSSEAMSSAMMEETGTTGGGTTSTAAASSVPFDQAGYDGCINAATEAHNQRWAATCAQKKSQQESLYLACVNKGQTQSYCEAQFPYQNIGSTCTLSVGQTNTLNAQYSAAKQKCANQYGA